MAITTLAISVGDNCVDHYLPPIERCFVGGNGLNVAVHMQRTGLPAAYIGAVGNDEKGKFILNGLQSLGVDIAHVQVLPGQTSQTDIRLTPEGDRIFVHETIGPVKTLELDRPTKQFIYQHKLVHNTWLGGTVKYLAEFKKAAVLVSLDYGERYPAEFLDETVGSIDIAFLSLPEGEASQAPELARQVAARGPRLVVVTLGREGSLAFNGKCHQQPAIPAQVVDTLGAGDTFIGVFLAHWLKIKPLDQCLLKAAQAAARTCTHYGAWE
jgi:fructoselysine 6-kinase